MSAAHGRAAGLMRGRLRPRHYAAIALVLLIGLPLLWLALAYGGLPRLWSHHEHRKMGDRAGEMISYTAQDIPGDPLNLRLSGSAAAIDCAFTRAGWSRADPLSLNSSLRIARSVIGGDPYPKAPVSPLYVADRQQDLAFELDEGTSARKRHHVRLWSTRPDQWIGAASFDKGVGLSLFTLQITHRIGPDVDAERSRVGALVIAAGGHPVGATSARLHQWHRNGGGDRYYSDGEIAAFALPAACPPPALDQSPHTQ
jgi:hypothetical protein